jgi:ribose/xylose/arabinose/galactoside ABC-type transport system permease subunit
VILKINDNYSNTLLGGLILLAIVVDRAREHWGKSDGRKKSQNPAGK